MNWVHVLLTINLAAIQRNWLKLAKHAPATCIGGVIKANAYGLGASEVGNALFKVGCREFFLASLSEGLAARDYLPESAIIYIFGGAGAGEAPLFVKNRLIPVLYSLSSIHNWVQETSALTAKSPSVIKINTGMTRFGLDVNEFEFLCSDVKLLSAINPVLCMSHLACADEPHNLQNQRQHQKFVECIEKIKKIFPNLRFSLANSSGIFLGKDWHFDLVRSGAALYGINPMPGKLNPMESVVNLHLPILQVRQLIEDSAIGYGADKEARVGARLAVALGGYADGLHRTIGLQPEGQLRGAHVNALGRISMDTTIFDISEVDLSNEEILECSIEVLGDTFTLEYLTHKNKLLGYEVLTSLGQRYKRNYLPGFL